ncbi:fibronectin type III domain-containing protein [Archangium primigenium]|uniref:fibronectin type III domain-containing protein n=1 Tax=[Archangium] primigenium TaxID=2792470 RepID=UPI00195B0248|nr:fibronectin type III domain-containing protein [Archangium primigenium]MBM7118601.1 fibronectin type III domain-containing protein [Archangium primigenium]
MSVQRSLVSLVLASTLWVGCGPGEPPAPATPVPTPEAPGNDVTPEPRPTEPAPGPGVQEPRPPVPDQGPPATDAGVPDAGPPDLDAGLPDAGGPDAGSLVVHGSHLLHYRTDVADFTQPRSPPSTGIQAFALESGGGLRPLTVALAADGSFRIPDAPAGQYYLRYGTLHLLTDARSVNLDGYELGRQDAQPGEALSPATLTAYNLPPPEFDSFPTVQAISSNLGLSAYIDLEEAVPGGATAIVDRPATYSQYYPANPVRLDASRGDYQYITTFAERSTGAGLFYSAVDRYFTQGGLSMNPGTPLVVRGELLESRPRTLVFDWWRSRFEAYRHQVSTQVVRSAQYFTVSPTAWSADHWYGYVGDLMSTAAMQGYSDERLVFSYGNPYPFSWGEVLTLSHNFQVNLRLPGTTSGSISVGLADTRPIAHVSPQQPFAPRITPAQDVTVDGVDAQQARTLGSLTPTVRWKAPLVGTPSAYRVRVSRLSASGTRTVATHVAYLSTKDTSVTVFPGILQPGQTYLFTVIAYLTPGIDLATNPYGHQRLTDVADADAMSAPLTTPAALAGEKARLAVEPAPGESAALELKAPRAR